MASLRVTLERLAALPERPRVVVVDNAARDPAARAGVLDALQGAGWVLGERRVVPAHVEAALRRLER